MGCPCELTFYTDSDDHAFETKKKAIARVKALDQYYTNYSETSFTAEINRSAGQMSGIHVDDETASLLDYADHCYKQSEGLFDITAGVLRRAWEYQTNTPALPKASYVKELLDMVGWDKIIWNKPTLILPIKGMHIDFGGIVKEYAADSVVTLLKENNIKHGLVDLGGDISIVGPHPDGSPWVIGVRDPRKPNTDIASIRLYGGALASSGDYERCIKIKGKRYGHILNPKTGWPISKVSAVSIAAQHCLVAGSLATISMLMDGKDILKGADIPYVLMNSKGKIIGKNGF